MQKGITGTVVVREDFLGKADAIDPDTEGLLASDHGEGLLGRSNRMPKKHRGT